MAVPVLPHKASQTSNTKNLLMSATCDPSEQQARQDRLDAAYFADGRDNPDHPHFSTYTALAETDALKADAAND